MFGEDRLISIFMENINMSPEYIKNKIVESVEDFREMVELSDDYTLLIIKI
jgi:serine phosphatase RsbU (regulator of sigma subunit)